MNTIKNAFIVDDEHFIGNANNIAQKILKHGRITKNGKIIIDDKDLTKDQILKLCLSIKFIAHELDNKIPQDVKPSELVDVMSERPESIGSRLSKLFKENFVKKSGFGQYIIHNYKIEAFVDSLTKNIQKSNETRKTPTNAKSGKRLTGIGADIQNLVDNNFFSKPKTIKDVEKELKKEAKYHDSRVIDATMKNVFMKRRIVKRIENENGGQAKWQYVIR